MSSRNYQQLRRAKQLLLQFRSDVQLQIKNQNFKQKRNQIKELAQNHLKTIKETPVPKFYNTKSLLMIVTGGLGISMLLKYQYKFDQILPERLLIDQPYPEDEFKMNVGKQSLYYYSQSIYFQALSGWSIVFLKRSRMVSPLYYLMGAVGFLVGTYLTDYYKHPNLKHSLWFLFNISSGAILGSYFYQQKFYILIDALYLIGNSMTFYAASCYYNENENKGILLTALGSVVFGTLYGLGVLRLFRWGFKLDDPKLLLIVAASLGVIMPWSIYRQICVQDDYRQIDYNPINAALSYQWKQIPQVSVFVDAFYHNRTQNHKNKQQQQQINQINIIKSALQSEGLQLANKQINEQQKLLLKLLKE